VHKLLRILGVAILYFLFGKLAFAISVSHGIVTNVPFFAEGIGLASTLLYGYYSAIGVFIGQFVLAFTTGLPLGTSLIISAINSASAILGRYLFYRLSISVKLDSIKDLLKLYLLILFILQPMSAILGNFTLLEVGIIEKKFVISSIISWCLGNSIGQFAIVPLLLLLFSNKINLESILKFDVLIGLAAFIITFLVFKLTHTLNQSFTFVTLLILFPVTFIFSSKLKPASVSIALIFIVIAAFGVISTIDIQHENRLILILQVDLLILSLQSASLILSVLISELKRANLKIESREKEVNKIIEHQPIPMIIAKGEEFIFQNQRFKNSFGYTEKEVYDLSSWYLHAYPDKEYRSWVEQTFRSDYRLYKETTTIVQPKVYNITTKKGDIKNVEVSIVMVDDLTIASFVDITEKLKNEKELRDLIATKNKFMSIIAHDLRNPFNALLGFSEILKNNMDSCPQEEFHIYVEAIHSTSINTYKLLENLLEWAKIQQHNTVFNPESLSLKVLLGVSLSLIESSLKSKKIKLLDKIPSDLQIMADKEMFSTILRNLLTNAVKFTHENGEIIISSQKHLNILEISIADKGIGMDEVTRKKLFKIEETKSIEGTSGETGTGLGLILCKEFIEKHGGQIWVESELGKGSNFKFTIPMREEEKLQPIKSS